MKRRWSKRALLEALMALLESPGVKMRRGKLRKEHGTANYERLPDTKAVTDIRIVIDPRNSPMVTIVIHELLHVFMAINHEIDLAFTDPLEEVMVEGLSQSLTSYLHDPKREKLFQRWLTAIDNKLNQ